MEGMFAGAISEKEIIAIIGGIIFIIVEIGGMSLSNRYYKQKYKLPLYGGGVVALLADIVIVFAGFCLYEGRMYGIALIILGMLMYCGVGFYNVKKCGKVDVGVRALLLQIVFALGSPFETVVFRRDRFNRGNAQNNGQNVSGNAQDGAYSDYNSQSYANGQNENLDYEELADEKEYDDDDVFGNDRDNDRDDKENY